MVFTFLPTGAAADDITAGYTQTLTYAPSVYSLYSRVTVDKYAKEEEETGGQALVGGTANYLWPTQGYTHISSQFSAARAHPVFGVVRPHKGVDIGAAYGSEIRVVANGTVTVRSFEAGGAGNYYVVDHGNGVVTKYMHLSKFYANQGDTLKRGDLLGYVGSTGASTGPHLHFQVEVGGVAVDPLQYTYEGYP